MNLAFPWTFGISPIDSLVQDLNLDREGESSLCFHIKVNGYDYTGYAYDSIETIRRRTHYSISFHSDKVYLPEKKMPKMSKRGFIGTSFDIHLEPVTALIDARSLYTKCQRTGDLLYLRSISRNPLWQTIAH